MRPDELGKYYESILEKEARKEGGVYYTPQYIVENTVGKFLSHRHSREGGAPDKRLVSLAPCLCGSDEKKRTCARTYDVCKFVFFVTLHKAGV